MPRPTRKPKKFNPKDVETNTVNGPVMSTPVHPKQHDTTNAFASPGLSPIQYEADSTIHDDDDDTRNLTKTNDFGFGRVRGVKKTVFPIHTDSDIDEKADDDADGDDDSVEYESDEDLYGSRPAKLGQNQSSVHGDSPSPRQHQPKPKKPVRKLRTSELLPLLPTRRKRKPTRSSKIPSLDTSDMEPEASVPVKRKPAKRREVDKENDVPEELQIEIGSDEERQIEERRKMIKAKFAEVDRWEMAFETVDVSFSSQ
jgi:hypothetical protein